MTYPGQETYPVSYYDLQVADVQDAFDSVVTRTTAELLLVTLDNYGYIICRKVDVDE